VRFSIVRVSIGTELRRYLALAGVAASFAIAVTAAFADPKPATKYVGNTSQDYDASLRTDRDGTAIRSFTIRREFDCGTETAVGTFRQSSGIMVIKPTGRFWGHDKVKATAQGSIRRGEFTIRGKFGSKGNVVRGTYRERVRLKNGSRCDTGEIRYRVKSQG
jgi:hypothetical protein